MCRALHSACRLGAPPSTTSIRQDARQSIHQHVQQLMQLLAASCQLTIGPLARTAALLPPLLARMRVRGNGALAPPYSTGMAEAGMSASSLSVGTLLYTSTLAAVIGSMKAFTIGKSVADRGALKMMILPTISGKWASTSLVRSLRSGMTLPMCHTMPAPPAKSAQYWPS